MAAIKQSCFFVAVLTLALVSVSYCTKKCGNQEPLDEHGCTRNQTYVTCNFICQNDRCPINDKPVAQCMAPPVGHCSPGCHCKINYRLNKEGRCILASECPAIKCTGKNQKYDSCPSDCLDERCEARNVPPTICNTLLLNCQPKCVCREGTWRNSKGVCVEPCECDV